MRFCADCTRRPVFPRHDGDDGVMDDGNFSRESLGDQVVLVAPKQRGRCRVGLNLSVRAITAPPHRPCDT